MPSSPNQRMKLLYLMKILLDRTDEAHPLTLQELLAALAEYGVKAERKSIYSDLELLRAYGLDVEARPGKSYGYYVGKRLFELPELKLLVDAVQSSRLITRKKSRELITKLSSLASSSQAQQLNRQVYVADRSKALNESVYYSVDAIHAAIHEKKKIRFRYFDYDAAKKRVYRREGEEYLQTPLALCWADDNYYLICFSAKHQALVHYRVDRMSDVSLCQEAGDAVDQRRFNVARHAKQVFGMYGGEMVLATLAFDPSLINVVLDRFGADVRLSPKDGKVEIRVEVSGSPVFLAWMFQFGDRAQILGPQSLLEAMRELVETNRAQYL